MKVVPPLVRRISRRHYDEVVERTQWEQIAVMRAIAIAFGEKNLPDLPEYDEGGEKEKRRVEAEAGPLGKFMRQAFQ